MPDISQRRPGDEMFDMLKDIAAAGARPYRQRFALERLDLIEHKLREGVRIDKLVSVTELLADIAYVRAQIGGIQ